MCVGATDPPKNEVVTSAAPTVEDTQSVDEAKRLERQRQAKMQGRRSTILTSLNEVSGTVVPEKTLLGQ